MCWGAPLIVQASIRGGDSDDDDMSVRAMNTVDELLRENASASEQHKERILQQLQVGADESWNLRGTSKPIPQPTQDGCCALIASVLPLRQCCSEQVTMCTPPPAVVTLSRAASPVRALTHTVVCSERSDPPASSCAGLLAGQRPDRPRHARVKRRDGASQQEDDHHHSGYHFPIAHVDGRHWHRRAMELEAGTCRPCATLWVPHGVVAPLTPQCWPGAGRLSNKHGLDDKRCLTTHTAGLV